MVYVGNFFGAVAIVLFVVSYQIKDRKNIILCNAASRVFYVVQYLLLGAYTGAIIDSAAGIISVVVSKQDDSRKRINVFAAAMLYAVIIAATIGFYKDVFSLFSFFGVTCELLAFFFRSEKKVRIVSFLGQPFWLIYNAHFLAWSSVAGNAITMLSILVALYRYRHTDAAKVSEDKV